MISQKEKDKVVIVVQNALAFMEDDDYEYKREDLSYIRDVLKERLTEEFGDIFRCKDYDALEYIASNIRDGDDLSRIAGYIEDFLERKRS